MQATDALDELWTKDPSLIRRFLDVHASYEKLAEEVAFILERSARAAGIEYANVTCRTKSLNSFCEKISRRGYKAPLTQMRDIAGVRITFLYLSDRPKLAEIVEKEFEVVEKADKVDRDNAEKFGYGALHYLVNLGKKASGARYDELKPLVCEIQVRTVLQDAWAIFAHHLSYKQKSDVPSQLLRKLNAISAQFETTDEQFDRLRAEREAYAENVRKQITDQGRDFLNHKINLEDLIEYLSWRFPDRERTSREHVAALLQELKKYNYEELAPVDAIVSASNDAIMAYESKYPPTNAAGQKGTFNAVGAVRMALSFAGVRPDYDSKTHEFRHTLKSIAALNKLREQGLIHE